MTRDQLIKALNITLDESLEHIYEKMFCAALVRQGTDITSKVLKDYNDMKEILRGRWK